VATEYTSSVGTPSDQVGTLFTLCPCSFQFPKTCVEKDVEVLGVREFVRENCCLCVA